jgi:hypothetical protein
VIRRSATYARKAGVSTKSVRATESRKLLSRG